MTAEELIIAVVRIAGSLPVLRWAFFGGVLAVLVDLSDLFLMGLLDLGGVRNYQAFDKWLDLAYMVTFLIAAQRWKGGPRMIASGLFAYRIAGVIAFEVVAWRGILLFFPNVFEFWFLFVAGIYRFSPGYALTPRRCAAWLLVLLALKEAQEYVLHWTQWLDRYIALDLVADWWGKVRRLFGG